jgi:hypothetical protein
MTLKSKLSYAMGASAAALYISCVVCFFKGGVYAPLAWRLGEMATFLAVVIAVEFRNNSN